MNRATGQRLNELEHIRQSIVDILTTPLGSRVMRRDYGSLLFELIDRPTNAAIDLLLMAASVDALRRWEPRVSIQAIKLYRGADGQLILDLETQLRRNRQVLNLNNLKIRVA